MKYSSLTYGFFLGLLAVAAVGIALSLFGLHPNWTALASLFGLCVGLVPVAELIYDAWFAAATDRRHLAERDMTLVERQARLDSSDTLMIPVAVPDENERAWSLALERFFRAGDLAGGFSIRKLDGVVGSTTWGLLTDFYCSEAGGRVLRVGPGDTGTTWGWGWQLDTVLQRVALNLLPHPAGPPPDVQPFVRNTTRRDTKRQRKTPVIIDNQSV